MRSALGAYVDDGFDDGHDGVHDCHEAGGDCVYNAVELGGGSAHGGIEVGVCCAVWLTQEATAPIAAVVLVCDAGGLRWLYGCCGSRYSA